MEGLNNEKMETFKDGNLSAEEAEIKKENTGETKMDVLSREDFMKRAQMKVAGMFGEEMTVGGEVRMIEKVMNHGVRDFSERS